MRLITNMWAHTRDLWGYRHEPERLRILADFYWRVLLVLAVSIVVGAALYGGMKLLTALGSGEGEITLSPSGGGGAVLNRADLQATLEGFATRQAQYEFLKKNAPKIADPSK